MITHAQAFKTTAPLASRSQFSSTKSIQGDILALLRAADAHLSRSVLTQFNPFAVL